jgi:hypothetical protein
MLSLKTMLGAILPVKAHVKIGPNIYLWLTNLNKLQQDDILECCGCLCNLWIFYTFVVGIFSSSKSQVGDSGCDVYIFHLTLRHKDHSDIFQFWDHSVSALYNAYLKSKGWFGHSYFQALMLLVLILDIQIQLQNWSLKI